MPSGGDRSTRSAARRKVILLLSAALLPLSAWAGPRSDSAPSASVTQLSTHVGEMAMTIEAPSAHPERETLRFEPWDMLDDLFRTDIVLLMRHGPTDWSKLDAEGVAPTDCANQRVLSPEGAASMVDLGILLAGNGIRPGKIVVSEWCRNQQTLAALRTGFAAIDLDYESRIEVETRPEANLLLSLQGAPNVTELRALISSWTGDGYDGPLLIISHFTNIAELTEFNVYEGEMLVLDPKRGNRVLGYLRLRSAGPDVGHFNTDQPARPR